MKLFVFNQANSN